MDAAETLRVVATALGALSTVLVAVVVVMRWMIAEQLQPIRNEMHATGRDVPCLLISDTWESGAYGAVVAPYEAAVDAAVAFVRRRM